MSDTDPPEPELADLPEDTPTSHYETLPARRVMLAEAV